MTAAKRSGFAVQEDARFPVSDWQLEVANGETRLGYGDWVKQWKEARGEDWEDCHVCGEPFRIDVSGIAHHVDDEDETDHDADADHVPYSLDSLGGTP